MGPWCHACGQLGEDFHRSVTHLAAEAVEGLTHADGRLWRTLPDLMLRPGRLTRQFLEGHRAPQIPPLRLFLVVLLGIFLVGGLTSSKSGNVLVVSGPASSKPGAKAGVVRVDSYDSLTPAQRAKVDAELKTMDVRLGDKPDPGATIWLRERVTRTLADPERFYLILEQWAERFAILMLPISALLLSLLFAFQRRFYLFDHTIFSLHSLSAAGLVLIAAMALSTVVDDWAFLLLALIPIHLFAHMRGLYRSSVAGTLIRMTLLFVGSAAAAALLVVGLIAVGLNGMGA